MISPPVSEGHSVTSPGTYASRRCSATASRHGSPPRSRAVPPSPRSRPSSTRIVVVLPAPFGPRKPCTSPAATDRSRPVQRHGLAEALAQPGDFDSVHGRDPTLNLKTTEYRNGEAPAARGSHARRQSDEAGQAPSAEAPPTRAPASATSDHASEDAPGIRDPASGPDGNGTAGSRDAGAVRAFIEGFTGLLTQAGFPRTPARIFVALLTSDSSRLTAAELGEILQTSPASVSGGVRYLIQVGLVTAEGEPGSAPPALPHAGRTCGRR